MKKQLTSAEKKQDAKYKKEKAAYHKKILGMNFDDFKKAFIEDMNETEKMILKTVSWDAEQRDMIVEAFGKGIKGINTHLETAEANFKVLNERLHALEGFTAIMAFKFKEAIQHKPMSFEERKGIADMISIKWDKSDDEAFNKAA
ncbi:MAG: hypothetical protein KA113_15480 [Syntrophaceae bacterium]|nr:hypothetical protein [Syntrophaceae bacterium]